MKRVFAAMALVFAGSALAAELNTVNVSSDTDALRYKYSVVCVQNIALKADVKVQYRYGDEGKWTDLLMRKNTIWMFTEKLPKDMDPDTFTVKFDADTGAPEEIVSALLKTQVHTWSQRNCDHTQNYKFLKDRTTATKIAIEEVTPE